jgi:epoxyqueuosine reductase QueG
MLTKQTREQFQAEPAEGIKAEIREFVRTSPLNRLPGTDNRYLFDEPLICFADGDDTIFTEYKTIIDPSHLTPREALEEAYGKNPEDLPERLSVISWILPIVKETRYSNRRQKLEPSRLWSYTRWYGEQFNEALRQHIVDILTGMGYLATAPMLQPYFERLSNEKGPYSNWSERHIAYAAGLGTFSLSDGFITERGIAHRCGSVVTSLVLPASPRTAESPYSNCLFYVDRSCDVCIGRCPAGAITEKGHDKIKCQKYQNEDIGHLLKEYNVEVAGCGLCQTKVPCEALNPARKAKRRQS